MTSRIASNVDSSFKGGKSDGSSIVDGAVFDGADFFVDELGLEIYILFDRKGFPL